MRQYLSEIEYYEIEKLVNCALSASNKHEAREYINRIPKVCTDLCGTARNILGELIGSTEAVAGQVRDKQRLLYFPKMHLFKLEAFIEY